MSRITDPQICNVIDYKEGADMNTAVVYYSLNGNTAYIAKKIAAELQADIIEIRTETQYPDKGIKKFLWGGKSAVMAETPELQPYEFMPEKYDQVIFGFPVWAGNVTPPVRTFIRDNFEGLKGKTTSAFACQSGFGAEKAFVRLSECLGGKTLSAKLVLNDPKDKPNDENKQKIASFCKQCR